LPGPVGWVGCGAGLAGLVGVGVGAGPDDARVVGVLPAGRELAVVGLAVPGLRAVVAVVPGAAVGLVVPGSATAVVGVVSAVAAVELVVAPGAPAAAN
jgi:hypothetical protein